MSTPLLYKPPPKDESDPEKYFLFVSSTLTLIIFFALLGYTLMKIKVHPYRPVIIVLISYSVCFISRFILDTGRLIFNESIDGIPWHIFLFLKIFNSFFDRVKWFSIFYFVFETREVHMKLVAKSHEE
jgi:hypothetical protein